MVPECKGVVEVRSPTRSLDIQLALTRSTLSSSKQSSMVSLRIESHRRDFLPLRSAKTTRPTRFANKYECFHSSSSDRQQFHEVARAEIGDAASVRSTPYNRYNQKTLLMQKGAAEHRLVRGFITPLPTLRYATEHELGDVDVDDDSKNVVDTCHKGIAHDGRL